MINEKEIRTGNLYSTTRNVEVIVKGIDTVNKYVIVGPVDAHMDITAKNANSIIFEDLNPIELTEARLLQVGFSKDEKTSFSIVSEKGAKFEWDENNNHIVLMDCSQGVIGQSIKYVHQFQNIYYYLTGKDLAII